MTTMFAARDARGNVRFVADVPRGAACACFCLSCNSPLVARKGGVNEWHFAHESDQERLECEVGLRNLLRRLVLEEICATNAWVQTPFTVAHPTPGREPLSWTAHRKGEITLLDAHGAMEAAAFVTLVEGGGAEIYISIGNEHVADRPRDGAALMHVHCPLPDLNTLLGAHSIRSEQDARAFVRRHMILRWQFLPDFDGSFAAAHREAQEIRERERRVAEEAQLELRRAAGQRWARVRQGMQQPKPSQLRSQEPRPPAAPALAPPAQQGKPTPEWAPGIVPETSVHYREISGGTRWVCYQVAGGGWRLAQVPHPEDGWDETFPPTLAVPDGDRWLRVVDYGRLLMFFNQYASASRITSDLEEIERIFSRR